MCGAFTLTEGWTWFCSYWSSGDCCCLMWWSSSSVLPGLEQTDLNTDISAVLKTIITNVLCYWTSTPPSAEMNTPGTTGGVDGGHQSEQAGNQWHTIIFWRIKMFCFLEKHIKSKILYFSMKKEQKQTKPRQKSSIMMFDGCTLWMHERCGAAAQSCQSSLMFPRHSNAAWRQGGSMEETEKRNFNRWVVMMRSSRFNTVL